MSGLTELALTNTAAAGVLALFVTLLTRLWRNPHVAHLLWLLVMVKLLVLPVILVPVPGEQNFRAMLASSDALPGESARPAKHRVDIGNPDENGDARAHGRAVSAAQAFNNALFDVENSRRYVVHWLTVVWLAGSIIWLATAGIRIWRFHRRVRQTAAAPDHLQSLAQTLSERLGLKHCPEIRVFSGRMSPMLWPIGWRRTILLPVELVQQLSGDERMTLLAHELAHVRRRDHLLRFLELLVVGLHWWNPIAWWARRQLRQAEEQCCDAFVVSTFPAQKKAYAQALFETVEFLSSASRAAVPAISGFATTLTVRRRLEMILKRPPARQLSMSWKCIVCIAAGVAMMMGPASVFRAIEANQPAARAGGEEAAHTKGSYQLDFSGQDYVVVPNLSYDGSHAITLEAFVTPYPRDPEPVRASVVANLELSGVGIHYKYKWFLFHVNDGRDGNGGYASIGADQEAELNQKVHVAAVFDGKKLSMYVDGKLQESVDTIGEKHHPSSFSFMIGADPNGKGRPHQFFKGRIDEVRISKVQRYTDNFEPASKLATDEDTLVLYHFDEGAGITAKDASGNGRHGFIHGAKWVREDAPIEAKRDDE